MQTKKDSILESVVTTVVGLIISLLSTTFLFQLFDVESNFSKNLGMTLCFSIISMARSYFIRRYFTKRSQNKLQKD